MMSSNGSDITNAKLNYKIGGSVKNLTKRNTASIYQTNPTQLMSTTGFDKNKFNSTVRYYGLIYVNSLHLNFLGS
jgi:hypothetical protein